jgi:hypothetical protein
MSWPPAGMAEPTGNGTDVHASQDQVGRGVVAQFVDGGADRDLLAHPPVPLRHRLRSARGGAIGVEREDEGVRTDPGTQRAGPSDAALAMLYHQRRRLGIEHDSAVGVCLGALLLPQICADLPDSPLKVEDAVHKVEMSPTDRAKLPTAQARNHGEPDQRAPVGGPSRPPR